MPQGLEKFFTLLCFVSYGRDSGGTVRHLTTLAPRPYHLAIGHHNCTVATCCFMPFRNPFLPSCRPSRPFDSVGFLPLRSRYTCTRPHSFNRHMEWNAGPKSAQFCRIIRPLLYWHLSLPSVPVRSVRLHVIVHSEQNMRALGPLTSP